MPATNPTGARCDFFDNAVNESALHEAPEERLLDRAVDGVERGLEESVTGRAGDEECTPAPCEPPLHQCRRHEKQGRSHRRESQLDAQLSAGKPQPGRPPPDLDHGHQHSERQEAAEEIGGHPGPAVGNTREHGPRSNFHGVRALLRLFVPVRVSGFIAARCRSCRAQPGCELALLLADTGELETGRVDGLGCPGGRSGAGQACVQSRGSRPAPGQVRRISPFSARRASSIEIGHRRRPRGRAGGRRRGSRPRAIPPGRR